MSLVFQLLVVDLFGIQDSKLFPGWKGANLKTFSSSSYLANGFQLFGITYLVGKIKFKLLFQDPLAKWELYTPIQFNSPWNVTFFPQAGLSPTTFSGVSCFETANCCVYWLSPYAHCSLLQVVFGVGFWVPKHLLTKVFGALLGCPAST